MVGGVRIAGVFHMVYTAELIDGRVRFSAPMDCDGNTARVTLACQSSHVLVNPGALVFSYDEICDDILVDCMTCLVKNRRY